MVKRSTSGSTTEKRAKCTESTANSPIAAYGQAKENAKHADCNSADQDSRLPTILWAYMSLWYKEMFLTDLWFFYLGLEIWPEWQLTALNRLCDATLKSDQGSWLWKREKVNQSHLSDSLQFQWDWIGWARPREAWLVGSKLTVLFN